MADVRPIDANALIKMMVAENNRCPGVSWKITDIERYVTKLLPTINPDDIRPHGWWGFIVPKPEMIGYFQCSQCAFCNGMRKSNYCPSCGAKMDGKENEDG